MLSMRVSRVKLGLLLLGSAAACSSRGISSGAKTVPFPLRPFQGEFTGSVWAERSLRPTFEWTAVAGADGYEIQVEAQGAACVSPSQCDFGSPVVDLQTSVTNYSPGADLTASMLPPVGARYFWRVRACFTGGCGDWSATRYVEVGRQRQDFNGDGYGDLVVSTVGGVAVYYGGPTFTSAAGAGWTVASPAGVDVFGASVTWADMNADGFADLAFVACSGATPTPSSCAVSVYFGGEVPSQTSDMTVGTASGLADYPMVIYGGDSTGTGVTDLVASQATAGLATSWIGILSGASSSMATTTLSGSATRVVGGCDLDADGKMDLLTTEGNQLFTLHSGASKQDIEIEVSPLAATESPFACGGDLDGSGHAAVVMLATGGGFSLRQPAGACDGQPVASPDGGVSSAVMAGMMDLNGDGIHDIVVGDKNANRIVVAYGGSCPPQLSASWSHNAGNGSLTGYAVASPGDMDGDGFDEIAVSGPVAGIDSIISGNVYVFRGGAVLGSAPDWTLTGPGEFGLFID